MPISTTVVTQSNGVGNKYINYFATSAATAAITTFSGIGFTPRKVTLRNLTDRISDVWYEGMASASSLHTVANGTVTLETTNGVAVSGDTVTFTATTMVASKVYALECEM
jgi:hypothetical protein